MKVIVHNEQTTLPISKKYVERVVKALLELEKEPCFQVYIYFVDEKRISSLHKEFFQDPSSTDCISFPIDEKNEPNRILGEVFVCTDIAKQYGLKRNIDPLDEALLYLVHGLLHLMGYDDIESMDRKIMRKKEKKHMEFLKKNSLALGIKHIKNWNCL